MAVSPRGNTWEVYVKRGAQRYRVAAKTEAQGKAMEAEILRCIDNGKAVDLEAVKRLSPTNGGRTLRECIDVIHALRWDRTKAGDTALLHLNDVASILGAGKPIDSITRGDVDELVVALRKRGIADATINRKMSALRVLLDEAHERGWCGEPPKLPHWKEGKGRVRFLTETEERSLLDMTTHIGAEDFTDLWAFLLDTGARIGEALALEWVDVAGPQVTFCGTEGNGTKNGEVRTVPLTRRAASILAKRRNYARPFSMTYPACRHWWDRVRVLLGKEDDGEWVIHILRHTCASRLVQRGVALLVVKEWMGHKSLAMTLRYAHLAPSNLRAAVAVLDTAPVAELVDASALEADPATGVGSSPSGRTIRGV